MNVTSPTCTATADDTFALPLDKLASAQGLDLRHTQPLAHDIHHWHTKEGAHVQFIASPDQPMFDLVLRFRAGSALDGDTPGLAALTLYLLDQGTGELDAMQFVRRLEGVGAIMHRRISRDYAMITLRSLSMPALRGSAVRLIAQMVAHPAFRPDDFANIRQRLNLYHQSGPQDVVTILQNATEAHVFGTHPYATPPAGSPEGLARITLDHVKAFHRQAYTTNNLEIGLVGDLSPKDAQALVASLTQALPQHWTSIAPRPLPITRGHTVHLQRSGSNTTVLMTFPLRAAPTDTDYPALMMVNQILGASYESRLTAELRSRRGLTYRIDTILEPMDAGCMWQIVWDIEPSYRDASLALVSELIECFIEQGPTEAEYEFALNQFSGQLLRTMANSAILAKGLTILGNRKQPADHLASYLDQLAALEPEDIRQVARGVNLNEAFVVTAGPAVDQQPLPTIGEPAPH
ncbi:insulinase family protein [Pseudomonas putida]|nr:insulinase family protein [Pseudomonas putida]